MATKERLAKAAEEFEANPCSRESWHAACELAIDWLAERDQTPLTASVLNEFGARWLPSRHGILTATFDCDNGGVMRVAKWRATDRDWVVTNYNTPISTVGELRTLARLAGVELKGHE